MEFKVFIVNMDRYNKASELAISDMEVDEQVKAMPNKDDFGAWFDFPIDLEELGKVICETIGSSSEDGYEITNIECGLFEYQYTIDNTDILAVNEDAEDLADKSFDSDDTLIINALLENDYMLCDALRDYVQYEVIDAYDEEDLGKELADRNGVSVDYELEDYVNWESYAEDSVSRYYFYDGRCAVCP